MKISLIIATLNREKELLNMVQSIINQSYDNYEIIIVDQSDLENTIISKINNKIKYVHINERGLSHARNIGIKLATGDIIGFADDDAIYEKNTFKNVIDEFMKKDLSIVSGIVIDQKSNKLILKNMKQKKEIITLSNCFRTCISASLFIKSNVFKTILFDEKFGIGTNWGSGEETDIVLQILYKKMSGVFIPNNVVFHPVIDKCDIPLEKVKKYSLGFGALISKHVYVFRNNKIKRIYYKTLLKHLIGLLLSIFSFNFHMVKFYFISFKYKLIGYKQYKEYFYSGDLL